MGNKMYRVVEDDNGKRTRIFIKEKNKFDGIKLDRRTGSGYHDNRPKRQRTRRECLRVALECDS